MDSRSRKIRPPRPLLRVEGIDDLYALVNLLKRNGVPYAPGKISRSPVELPEFSTSDGVDKLIDEIDTVVQAATNKTVGFILDADSPVLNRWRRVHHRLTKAGVVAPADRPPPEGFIGESKELKARVGVWLMPDNEHDGKLEDFLKTLIDDGDPLIGHAQASTDQAKVLGATFSEPDAIKAVIHSWLAWQGDPGKPYGLAMEARYFRDNSPAADRFVAWFKRLYGLEG